MRKRWALLVVCAIIGLVASGCGARIEQTIELQPDGSGKVMVIGVDEIKDIEENVEGGLEGVKKVLEAKVPPNWHLDITTSNGKATYTITTTFRDGNELRQRLAEATGTEGVLEWTTTRTPFYQRHEMKMDTNRAWAKWALDAVATVTRASTVESVTSYVKWPGRDRQILNGRVTNEERRSVESFVHNLTWTANGATRTVDLRPSADQTLFQPVADWVQETLPGATVKESAGTYQISFPDTKAPWGAELQITHERHNLFWDRVVLQEPAGSVLSWLGPSVDIEEITHHFKGQGWWSMEDQGPPKWYRWPIRSTSMAVDAHQSQIGGYVARIPLYVAWGLGVPLLAFGLAVGIPLGWKRARKDWPRWAAMLRGGMRMSTNVRPKFCSTCGQPLLDGEPCACGEVAAGAGAEMLVMDAQPIGLWAKHVVQGMARVLVIDPQTVDMPLQAAIMSMLARALVLAFAVHRFVNMVFTQALSAVGRAVPLLSFFQIAKQTLPTFGWILLALLVASSASLFLLYLRIGVSHLPRAAMALADAQWPVVYGAAAAWILSYVSPVLSAAGFIAGVSWGQTVLTTGLGRLPLSYRQRVGIQAALAFSTVLVTLVIFNMGAGKVLANLIK